MNSFIDSQISHLSGKLVNQVYSVLSRPSVILWFMKRRRIKEVAPRTIIAIILALLFASLLAQRLFHPR
jgi:hypothetical protein